MKNLKISLLLIYLLFLISCNNKDTPVYDRDMNDSLVVLKRNQVVSNQLDSIEFLENLGKQKLPDVYDLAIWKMKTPDKDSVLNNQLQSYFWPDDTLSIPNLYAEIDSLGAYYSNVDHIKVLPKDTLKMDSLGKMQFSVYYFNKDKKYITKREKQVNFLLQKQPEKLKNQFSFYLLNLAPKDTISSGKAQ